MSRKVDAQVFLEESLITYTIRSEKMRIPFRNTNSIRSIKSSKNTQVSHFFKDDYIEFLETQEDDTYTIVCNFRHVKWIPKVVYEIQGDVLHQTVFCKFISNDHFDFLDLDFTATFYYCDEISELNIGTWKSSEKKLSKDIIEGCEDNHIIVYSEEISADTKICAIICSFKEMDGLRHGVRQDAIYELLKFSKVKDVSFLKNDIRYKHNFDIEDGKLEAKIVLPIIVKSCERGGYDNYDEFLIEGHNEYREIKEVNVIIYDTFYEKTVTLPPGNFSLKIKKE